MAKRLMLLESSERQFIPRARAEFVHQPNSLNNANNDGESLDNVESFIALFPKSIRTKGALLLRVLKDYIKVDSNGRVIYEDGTPGSSVYDHVRYFCGTKGKEGTPRPPDAEQFASLMRRAAVPKAALSIDKRHILDETSPSDFHNSAATSTNNWRRIFKH